jgi:1-phosphatidylinositol phosphodiesterase
MLVAKAQNGLCTTWNSKEPRGAGYRRKRHEGQRNQMFGELDVTSCEGQVYIICQGESRRPLLVIRDAEGRWIAPEKIHDGGCWDLPAIAILNGNLICVWVGGRGSQRKLLWSQRLAPSSIAMKEWMSRIDSDVYLSELSIPGSHESCATIAVPWVQCQNISVEAQLNSGLRYFDFRCGVSFGSLYLFHGRSPLGFSLTEVLARMYAWLARAPQEAIIVQMKMEGGSGDETAFEKLLRSQFTENAKFWALGTTIPKLGAVRGKIQLMRRFHISTGTLGIDVRQWADNSPKFIIPLEQHERVVVQDRYEYTDVVPTFAELVRTKSSAVDGLIVAANNDRNLNAWYLNWCNAYALPLSLGVLATPADMAMGRNDIVGGRRQFVPGVNSSLFRTSFLAPVKGRHGTILLDFAETPEPGLVAAIVMSNTFNSPATHRYC